MFRFLRQRSVSIPPFLILALVVATRFLGAAPDFTGSPPPEDGAVKLEPVEVKSDPFRTLGLHGEAVATLFGGVHMYIEGVNPASPSAKSGLQAGDEFVEIGGKTVGVGTIFSLRSLIKEAVASGKSIPAVVRPIHGKETRQVLLQAMVEPKHRWLPVDRVIVIALTPRDPVPAQHGNAFSEATWRDQGCAAPQAALETLFFRLTRGDVAGIASEMEALGSAQTALTGLFQSLPKSGQAYYERPERLLAALVAQEERPKWVYIRSFSTPSAAVATFDVDEQFWDDCDHLKIRKTFSFHHSAQGWRWAPSTGSIKKYAEYYRGVPFELAPPAAVPAIAWFFHSN